MDKFLFTDGISGVKEVQSLEQLENVIELSTNPEKCRIWIFNNSEWISYAAFRKIFPSNNKREKNVPAFTSSFASVAPRRTHPAKKILVALGAAVTIFLVFNFTKINWRTDGSLTAAAARPANAPFMDVDSLISVIEYERGQVVDRSTRTNLRIRNTWPDLILLQVDAAKEKSSTGSRYSNVNISIDNTTGFSLDNAVVKLLVWKNNKATVADTFHFGSISYDKIAQRQSDERYRGDSISVEFESIRAKAFNFCYASSLENQPGSHNDRWFCRD